MEESNSKLRFENYSFIYSKERTHGKKSRKRREDERRKMAQSIPNRTLFVVSFDPYETRERDLRNAFEPFGNVVRVSLKLSPPTFFFFL